MTDDLKTRGVALSCDDRGPSQEYLPDTIQTLTILGADLALGVRSDPVVVPLSDGVGVVDANRVA